ncbi:MAG: nitroreductase family protein [Synergistaceae bacterium]|jgi:nitroreductase|nr:nitroreductase family protein [Synergistaceae bacterium]
MEVKEAMLTRRSVRKYKSQAVSDEDLRDIIDAALYAPSATNVQPWYFLALKSQEAMDRFRVILGKTVENFIPELQKRFPDNPQVVAETENFLKNIGGAPVCILAFLLKHEDDDPNYKETFTKLQSVSAGIQNMLLAAWEKGLGSCWMTAIVNAGLGEDIRGEFAPDHGSLVAAIAIGYPDHAPKAPKRKEGRFKII